MRVAAAILAITALSFFVFPGHTYLQQDTQIYVPILENQWSGALSKDMLVQRPHVNFTLYDELTNSLRWLTRAPLAVVLEGEQLVFRALGFVGIYLIAVALELDAMSAIVVTAIVALGATITGPAVLTIEYEPTPRAFAVPLLLLAVGLALRERFLWAGLAGGCAILLHAPTVWPFLISQLSLIAIRKRAALSLIPMGVAATMLAWIGLAQAVAEPQHLFGILPAAQEQLQRMRAGYNYVSTWWAVWMGQYLVFAGVAALGLWRLRVRREPWLVLGSLVLAGLGSIPVSWLLLEHFRLSVIPQIQPARALLFVTEISVLVSAAAGCSAANARRWMEAAVWFWFALWVPTGSYLFLWPELRVLAVVFGFGLALAATSRGARLAAALLLAPAMAIPAGIVNYRNVQTGDLNALAVWARSQTRSDAVFAFPEAGRDRSPGWFRSTAMRTVFVDWKAGGQLNYLEDFGYEWWRRWQAVMQHPRSMAGYRALGIDFLVLPGDSPEAGPPVFTNPRYRVYATSAR